MGMDGAIVLDKPEGITSHGAVVAVRRLLSAPRVGHLGTLDPLASGVLVLLIGRATRLAQFYQDREKTYEGVIRFGFSTTTFDAAGTPTSGEVTPNLKESEIRGLFGEFGGTHLQAPPPFSAKKISGVPAHRLARKGQPVELRAVPVIFHELTLLSLEGPLVRFRARVSAGTYIRSLAQELGQRLGVGAHLAALRRTAVGEFRQEAAIGLEPLQERVSQETIPLIPLENLLPEIPAVAMNSGAARNASQGQDLVLTCESERVRLFAPSGRLVAIALRRAGSVFHPMVVMDPD